MLVTITTEDIGTIQDHGSVALITATGNNGSQITFGVEPRMLDDIARVILFDDLVEVEVEIEAWQILGSVA